MNLRKRQQNILNEIEKEGVGIRAHTVTQKLGTTFWPCAALSSSDIFCKLAATLAKYIITFFVFSVLPAPDSPLLGKINVLHITHIYGLVKL